MAKQKTTNLNNESKPVNPFVGLILILIIPVGCFLYLQSQGHFGSVSNHPIEKEYQLGNDYNSEGNIPRELVLSVDNTLKTQINGLEVEVTLVKFSHIVPIKFNERSFSINFLIRNKSNVPLIFSPTKIFTAANNSGFRIGRGGGVSLKTEENITVDGSAEKLLTLDGITTAFNTIDGNYAAQTIWIVVNSHISENLSVTLKPGSGVFAIYLPEIQK